MYFMALATDYDGTLASDGKVSPSTINALAKLKASGRKLIMVTGRTLDELKEIFEELTLFDRIVAENGALLYTPQTEVQQLLVESPPPEFIRAVKEKGITPLYAGKTIISTEQPQEIRVLEVIRDMGLELDIIFNRSSVMVLPSGVNKATGLEVALKELGLSMHNVVGIGDAENDHAFLRAVGLSVAVANATEAIKENAAWITEEEKGKGVEELIMHLLKAEDELINKVRHRISLGQDNEIAIAPTDRILIAGSSGIGKSTLATLLTEKMVEMGFQFSIFDPEGDYEKLDNTIGIGEIKSPPSLEKVIELLQDPSHNVVVNTLGVDLKDRPVFFAELAPKIITLKGMTGRPHWLIIDEAHHLIPKTHQIPVSLPETGLILITVHPDQLSVDVLKKVNNFIILGEHAPDILEQISQLIEETLPTTPITAPTNEEVLIWQRSPRTILKNIKAEKPRQQHKRHTRKYAEGDLYDEFCFYFRGPKDALHIKAQNLMIFLQIAEGIDDATWMHHLKRNDYSDWFCHHIKDERLAEAAVQIENDSSLSPDQSREAIAALVRELYTAPASSKD